MKKHMYLLLVFSLIATCFTYMPASAATPTVHLLHDFNEGITAEGTYSKSISTHFVLTGESYPWETTKSVTTTADGTALGFSYDEDGDTENTTGYLKGAGKFNSGPANLKMELTDAEGTKHPIIPAFDELMYIDARIQRPTGSDPVYLSFFDSNNKPIARLFYSGNTTVPALVSGTTPNVTGVASDGSAWSYASTWWYFRLILNYTSNTFEAFQSKDGVNYYPFSGNETSYPFISGSGATEFKDFWKVEIGSTGSSGNKGVLSIDDFTVSTLKAAKPSATNVTMSGKSNIGETLTGTYGQYVEPSNITEGISICYWERANNAAFTGAVKIEGTEKTISSGQTSEYTITEDDSEMYVRFCVVPYASTGEKGSIIPSAASLQINVLSIIPKVLGQIKNNTIIEFKGDPNKPDLRQFYGSVDVTSTLNMELNLFMVTAWYKNDELLEVFIDPLTIPSGTNEPDGKTVITAFKSPVYVLEDAEHAAGISVKVFVINSPGTMKPISKFIRAAS